ncbi:MgtC/SapB family protein [Phenylobacterium sp.]|uniref:MgtC/SapB family protein n=1 Tax=Phenylobacterium sp. TaxID=1871053 RepID=UPI0011F7F69E|nr:MgtC/SapB family protein [Phenylobacterium sp.]THD61466.1 MAG: MgtC/SapB family protein [Phenylobacterium sp.]
MTSAGLDLSLSLDTLARLGAAFVLGGLIGLERQVRQRNAGLRTMVLVSVGTAAFVHLGDRLAAAGGEASIVAYVVSGIGFLGAGVIMKEGAQVRGLNTAATLWSTAAVGAFAGAGLLGEAAAAAVFVLAGNTLLRPLVDYVNRRPITPGETEALYQVHVTCAPAEAPSARDLLYEELERYHYPVREIEVVSEGDEIVELAATLVPTTASAEDLDAITAHLNAHDEIEDATWTVSTTS